MTCSRTMDGRCFGRNVKILPSMQLCSINVVPMKVWRYFKRISVFCKLSKEEVLAFSVQLEEMGVKRKEGRRSLGRLCYPGLSSTSTLAAMMIHFSCHLHFIEEVGRGGDSTSFRWLGFRGRSQLQDWAASVTILGIALLTDRKWLATISPTNRRHSTRVGERIR